MGIECPKCHHENPDDTLYCGKCTTPLKPLEEISPTKTLETPVRELKKGTTFASRYEIIEELGKGGMGRVYQVKDQKLDEEMALKVLKPEIAADRGMIERFKNELKLARKIAHKSICKMYDLNEEEETPYITMEYVKGEDLKSFIRRKEKLSEEETIAIAKQVCEGLKEAHELGVIHRDLKPQNIMIDEKNNAKVMDFGIARSVEAPGITHTGMMIGTPDYISPEQAEGEEADQRSDIYALGVILYEMVTGSVPFKGDTAFSVALKHKTKLPQDPKKINPDISENLSRLVLICLEKERERRYQTAEGLLNDLRNLEDGLPLGTKIRPRRETFIAALIRKKLFIPSVVVALAIIAVVIWQLLLQKGASSLSPDKPSIVVLPFTDTSPLKDQEYFCDGLINEIILDLSQVSDLSVRSYRSAMTYKGMDKTIKEIREELNVQYALDATVRKAGNDLSITATLIDTKADASIWADKYSGTLENVFDIQDEISIAIVSALKLKLSPEEKQKITKRAIENTQAYECYVKARYEIFQWTEDSLERALRYLKNGMDIIGDNVLLYAGIGYVYFQYVNTGQKVDEIYLRKAEECVEKIFKLEPDSFHGHRLLGLIEYKKGNAQEVVRHLKRAIAINPNDPDSLMWLNVVYMHAGKTYATAPLYKKLLEIDPLNHMNHSWLGYRHLMEGNFDRALGEWNKVYQMDPKHLAYRRVYARILAFNNRPSEACSIVDSIVKDFPESHNAQLSLFLKYALLNEKNKALKLATQDFIAAVKSDEQRSLFLAECYALMNEKDKALDWLENAANRGFINYPFLYEYDLFLENIRGEERFKKLMERVKYDWKNFEV